MFPPTATVNIEVNKGGKLPSQCPTHDVTCYMLSKNCIISICSLHVFLTPNGGYRPHIFECK